MNNTFKLLTITKKNNRIEFDYEVTGAWQQYFTLSSRMFIEYNYNIEDVPDSVAVIPLISNILPTAWLCNAEIIISEIDQDFYLHLDDVKRGYKEMYPMLEFNGKLTISKLDCNLNLGKKDVSAAFFSGGVDAFSTLLRHSENITYLITVWGADVKLYDNNGWEKVKRHVLTAVEKYNCKFIEAKSNFREIIDEGALDLLVWESGDGWWHGFQHGIGLISHIAPIAYIYRLTKVYIASSFSERMKGQYTCASDPTIDNHVMYCGCRTIHDGYELDRQEKVRYLVKKKKEGKFISLRVCWESLGGK